MVKSKASKRSQKSNRSNASQCADEIVQCPHLHFKSDVIDRNVLSKEQHLNLLSTPKGYRWEEPSDKKEGGQGESTENLPTNVPRRVVCSGRRMRKPEKVYVHNFLAEVWTFLTPEMIDRLKGMLMNEFGMSPQEADQLVNEQRESNIVKSSTVSLYKKPRKLKDGSVVYDSIVKLRSPNKSCDKYPKSSIGIRNSWIRNFSDMLSEKVSSYVLDTMCAERTERQQEIAQTLLTRFNTILEQKASMTNPRTKTHKAMVLVADKLSLWLDKNVKVSKETAQRLKELEEEEKNKRLNDERKKRDEEKKKLEAERKAKADEEKRLADEEKRLADEKQKAEEEAQKEPTPGEPQPPAEETPQEQPKPEDAEAKQPDTQTESAEPPKTEEAEPEKPPSEAQPTEDKEPKDETQPESAEEKPESDEQKPETEEPAKPEEAEPEQADEEKGPESADQPPTETDEEEPPEPSEQPVEDTEPKGESEEPPKTEDAEKAETEEPPKTEDAEKAEEEESEKPPEEIEPPKTDEESEKPPETAESEAADTEREPSLPGSPQPGETPAETPDETPADTPAETPAESGVESEDEKVPESEEEKVPESEEETKPGEGEETKPGEEGFPGDVAMVPLEEEKAPGDEPTDKTPSPVDDVIRTVASIIAEQEASPTPRQEAIKDVMEKELEKQLGDQDHEAINEVAAKVGTWMDQVVDKVEEEYADKGSPSPPVAQRPKGPIFKLRKMESAFDVELISNTKAGQKVREARGKHNSPYKTVDTNAPLEPADLKEWAKWASAVTDMAQNWAEWIEDTVQEAQKKGDDYKKAEEVEEKMKDWEKFKDKKSSDAVEWRRTKKQVDQQAKAWSKKTENDKLTNQQMEKDKGMVNVNN